MHIITALSRMEIKHGHAHTITHDCIYSSCVISTSDYCCLRKPAGVSGRAPGCGLNKDTFHPRQTKLLSVIIIAKIHCFTHQQWHACTPPCTRVQAARDGTHRLHLLIRHCNLTWLATIKSFQKVEEKMVITNWEYIRCKPITPYKLL